MPQSCACPSSAPSKPARPQVTPPSAQSARHNAWREQALAAHPELTRLQGSNPWTALAIPVLLAIHWGTAYWLQQQGNLLYTFVAAFFIGQLVLHSAGGLLHETAHRAVFRGRWPKRFFDAGLELIMGSFSKQLTYQHEHVSSHHRYQGDYERDYEHEDICAWAARQHLKETRPGVQRALTVFTLLLHSLPFGFLVGDWLLPKLYAHFSGLPVKDVQRRIPATQPTEIERKSFMVISLLLNLGLLHFFGVWAWLYHNWALSLFLGKMGVWNLGQSLSEHEGDNEDIPTRSYYGPLNYLLFNTGHHLEHHVFVNVPWNRLPALRATAPEIFCHETRKSYAAHWWAHVCNDFSASRRSPLQYPENKAALQLRQQAEQR